MEDKIYILNNNIEELMKKKFGKSVDLDEIQEAQLKKLIFDLRMSMLDIRNMYEEELHQWRVCQNDAILSFHGKFSYH